MIRVPNQTTTNTAVSATAIAWGLGVGLILLASCWPSAAAAADQTADPMQATKDPVTSQIVLTERGQPVLQYNYQTVEPGDVLKQMAPENCKYARPRSDYIHPLYGLDAEVLTKDWSLDHPHHRGIYWAWPEVTWHGETADLHALQRVFARPTGRCVLRSGPDILKRDQPLVLRFRLWIHSTAGPSDQVCLDQWQRFQAGKQTAR